MIKIYPSIIAADQINLKEELKSIEQAGASGLHLDIMDGHFVPNLTIGPDIVKSLRKSSKLDFHAHLMISNPLDFIDVFAESGVNLIIAHIEVIKNVEIFLEKCKKNNLKTGLSLLPDTNPEFINSYLNKIDQLLVMTVNPGFCAQEFMKDQLQKIRYFRQEINRLNLKTELAVDGGINEYSAKLAVENGAESLVSGSFIFSEPERKYEKRIRKLFYADFRNF